MTYVAADLPSYRANIRQKIADVRQAGKGGSVEKVQETLEDIKTEIEKTDGPQRGLARRRDHGRAIRTGRQPVGSSRSGSVPWSDPWRRQGSWS